MRLIPICCLLVYIIFFHSSYYWQKKTWENRAVERLYEKSEVVASSLDDNLTILFTERRTEWNKWMKEVKADWYGLHPNFKPGDLE